MAHRTLASTVKFADTSAVDAFGRLRTSSPYTIFDSKQVFDNQPYFWDELLVGSGSSAYTQDRASTTLTVAASSAGRVVRQTFMRFNYQPGKSQSILMTGVLALSGSGTGNTFLIGFGDDDDGLFFRDVDGVVQVVRRTSVTGTMVETAVPQSEWNHDTLDGTGASGFTFDKTKANIFTFDFEWLGVGRVRFGIVINGQTIYVHEMVHANEITTVYMRTPNLPLRYEVENDGAGGAGTLVHICSTVISEGGVEDIGLLLYESTGAGVINANTVDTIYVVCGLRLKTTALGATVLLSDITVLNTTSDDYEWMVLINPTLAAPVVWADVTNGVVQFATGDLVGSPSTTTVAAVGQKVAGGYVKGSASSGAFSTSIGTAFRTNRRIGVGLDAVRDALYLCVRPLSANADIRGGMIWRELS